MFIFALTGCDHTCLVYRFTFHSLYEWWIPLEHLLFILDINHITNHDDLSTFIYNLVGEDIQIPFTNLTLLILQVRHIYLIGDGEDVVLDHVQVLHLLGQLFLTLLKWILLKLIGWLLGGHIMPTDYQLTQCHLLIYHLDFFLNSFNLLHNGINNIHQYWSTRLHHIRYHFILRWYNTSLSTTEQN